MDFRILGPLEVRSGNERLQIGGPRQHAILATLLLDAGHVVPMDRLVDAVWGNSPPATAREQVQNRVSGLRRVLAAAGGPAEQIIHRPPGYILLLSHDQVDANVFAERVRHARKLVKEEQPEEAARSFREGLALWRGDALSGLKNSALQANITMLTEARLAALEECVDVELAMGRHHELIGELSAAVTHHPLRERPRAQLMVALARAGRSAEALEVYRRGRDILIEELGLEPGPDLRKTERQILTLAGDTRQARPRSQPRQASLQGQTALTIDPVASIGTKRRRSIKWLLTVISVALAMMGIFNPSSPNLTQPEAARQLAQGPAWTTDPPIPLPSTTFGATLSSISGVMPGFKIGAVRFWDSRTRWANIQPHPNQFTWEILDRLVSGAERSKVPSVFVFGGTPQWAAPNALRTAYDDGSRAAPPDDLARWDEFVGAVADRFRGRIQAYELWDYPNHTRYFNGDMDTLVDMTKRASRIIRTVDPNALVVCPSFGDLWGERERELWRRFGRAGGYQHCDVAALKLYQRRAGEEPEAIVSLAEEIDQDFHRFGAHLKVWNTGGTYDIAVEPRVSEQNAPNYAARFFLVGIYNRFSRSYFYNWGSQKLPLVLQVEGGQPTAAARYVDRLQSWLTAAKVHSCGNGTSAGLPENAWQCRFEVLDSDGTARKAIIRWTRSGSVDMATDAGVYHLRHLDGREQAIRPGETVHFSEQPIMILYRD